jgi:predicted GNAT superfamily acetyltransferase
VVAGAFDPRGTLVGFVYGVPGVEDGRPIHWSDMLAVREDLRDRHLGERLKRWQRLDVLRRGFHRMYWSFDPLESRNAYFNLGRLGARVREYFRDMYGETDSPLHAGIPTDRLIPVWELDSPRVIRRLAGQDRPPASADVEDVPLVNAPAPAAFPAPTEPDLDVDAPRVRIAVPANIQLLKEAAPGLARAWRVTTRAAFESYFRRGYVAEELTRHGDWSAYLLRAAGDELP